MFINIFEIINITITLPYITIYYHILPKSIKTYLGLGLRTETRLSVLGKIQNIICIRVF